MPFIFRVLKSTPSMAIGSNNPLYTVGNSPTTSAIISNIRFYNASTASASAVLIFRPTSTSVLPSNFAKLAIPGTSSVSFNTELTLGQGNIIEASTSAILDVSVFGVERTQ